MAMWGSPDIRDHVKEQTDFRLGNVLNYYLFNARTDSVGEYDYVYAGEYDEVIVPDISANNLVNKLQELLNSADIMPFTSEANYQSSNIAYVRYNNVTLYQLILFLNRISNNADFNDDNLKTLYLLTQNQVNEFLLNRNNKPPRTARRIDTVEDFGNLLHKINMNNADPTKAVDDWLNVKITNTDFTDIQKTPFYQLLVDTYGEKFITNLVTQLDKYVRRIQNV